MKTGSRHAPPVCIDLMIVRRYAEPFPNPFVCHDHTPSLTHQCPYRLENLDRPGHVVEGLEYGDQVVALRPGELRDVAGLEPDPPIDSFFDGMLLGSCYGRLIQIEAVHDDVGIGLGHGDAGPSGTAPEVGHASGRIQPEPGMDFWHRREPLCAQELSEPSPVELRAPLRLPGKRRQP